MGNGIFRKRVKGVKYFDAIHEAQLLTYIRITGRTVGLLINLVLSALLWVQWPPPGAENLIKLRNVTFSPLTCFLEDGSLFVQSINYVAFLVSPTLIVIGTASAATIYPFVGTPTLSVIEPA